MQKIDYYREIFQENLKLILSFINSSEGQKIPAVAKRHEKARKKALIS